MEIINGYSSSMSLGTTVFDTITPETSTYNITSNTVYFFSGSYDTEVLYNTLTESTLLSTYASQYLGKISNVPLTFSYDDTKKERIIQNTTPNAFRFKDPRYVNNSYIMGTSFTKPTIGAKYKFKMTDATLNSGFLVNGSSVNVTAKKEYYKTYTDGFDVLFANGTSVNGGAIDLVNNKLYGYRVENGTGPTGYLSVPFSVLKAKGYTTIICNISNNSGTRCGSPFVGYNWDSVLTQSYDVWSLTITIDLVNLVVTNSSPTYTPSTVSLVGLDLSKIFIGIHAIQTGAGGWVDWNVSIPNESYHTYDIESDFFTTTGNITVTNPTALTYSGFEVVPYDIDGNVLSNDINWVAIKIKNDTAGDYFIYTDDIGTFYNPSFINLNSKTVKYGNESILHNVKIQYRDKSIGEII